MAGLKLPGNLITPSIDNSIFFYYTTYITKMDLYGGLL